MGRIVNKELWEYINKYFKVYLPISRGASKHTIRSYQRAVETFLDFVKKQRNVELNSVTFDMLDSHILLEFLNGIEEQGASVSTRNHRLNSIKAFFAYVAKVDATKIIYKCDIDKVPLKKKSVERVDYLSEIAVKTLLDEPDVKTMKGIRDSFIMLLMYDTAARLNGIVNLSICDIKLSKTPVVTLHEKGSKINTVPIMTSTVEHFSNYISIYHPDESLYSKEPLFYSLKDGVKKKIDDSTIRKFMKKYGVSAREKCKEIPENIHPHLLRHSRAMHLYQHGMDLTLVSQWLNHSKLETTLIYAHADTEQKRKAIELATSGDSPLKDQLNSNKFVVDDEDMLKRLYGLK